MSIKFDNADIFNVFYNGAAVSVYADNQKVFPTVVAPALPSGAIAVFDVNDPSSFTEGSTTLYDLSGNNFDATFVGTIGSGSDAGGKYLTLGSSNAQIKFGDTTTFRSQFQNIQNMYNGASVMYDAVPTSNEIVFSTWGDNTTIGYQFFLSILGADGKTRAGVQLYNSGGTTGAAGYYEVLGSGDVPPTGSRTNISMYATTGNFKSYIDNNQANSTNTDASKVFYYGTTGDQGRYVAIGNFNTGLPFSGKFYKYVLYNRSLTLAELDDIDTWLSYTS